MSTSILNKLISRPALLASAAILLTTGNALAADPAGDAQAQARELLAGATNRSAMVATPVAVPTGTSQTDLDPQEQARRLILGTPRTGSEAKGQPTLSSNSALSSGAEQRLIRRAYPDAHAQAERMITGKAG